MKIAVVASNASPRFGGESLVPFQIFRKLHERGVPSCLLTHERGRGDIEASLSAEAHKDVHYVPDSLVQRTLGKLRSSLPEQLCTFTVDLAIHLITERYLRALTVQMIREGKVELVHEPMPISPRVPSCMCGLQVPLVVGPLNGAMDYPPAFSLRRPPLIDAYYRWGRSVANIANWVIPGKRQADLVLVANERTKKVLPTGLQGQVVNLVENGVDLSRWEGHQEKKPPKDTLSPRFLYVGSFVECKAVDLLLQSFSQVLQKQKATLILVGDGPKLEYLKSLSTTLGISSHVEFRGWIKHEEVAKEMAKADIFTFPSLKDCGGAVVLEAMAMQLPVICAQWGGPADYVNSSCGILVYPESKEHYVTAFAKAMTQLAGDPKLRENLGRAGYERVVQQFQWEKKIDTLLGLYENLCRQYHKS